jgi:anti-anti-sigma factor
MTLSLNDLQASRRTAGSAFVTIRRRGSVVRATISGPRIGERESQIVAAEIHAAIEAAGGRMKHLVLDLADVRIMSSLGLGMCIDVRNAAKKRGADTVVIGLSHELADLFRMMKVDRLYAIVGSEEELQARVAD